MNKKVLTCIIIVFALSGCVKKSLHQDTMNRLTDAELQLDECGENSVELQRAFDREALALKNVEIFLNEQIAKIAELEAQLAETREKNEQLTEKLTNTIKDSAQLKESAEELMKALAELEKRKAEADARVKEFRDLLAKFKTLIDAGKLEVKIHNGRMVLVLPTDILFASGSAELSSEGLLAIKDVAVVLKTIKDKEFQVEGHTDNVPLASQKRFKDNWELASRRAMVVVEAMIEVGVKGQVLSAASYGEFRPVASNDNAKGRSKNRRIDIVIVPDLSTLPGFDELQSVVAPN